MSNRECPFCEIVAGRRPAHLVHRDDVVAAFLDARPVFHGHVLVVPVKHAETLLDLPDADVGPYFARVQALTRAVELGLDCDGALVVVNHRVSQSVPHLHTHIIPRFVKDGLRGFFWPRTRYDDPSHADRIAAAITRGLREDLHADTDVGPSSNT